jgi:ATP-binding cassette subfamily B protein
MRANRGNRFNQLIWAYLGHVKAKLFLAAFCIGSLALSDLLRPWPLKIIFDHILLDKPLPSSLAFLEEALLSGKTLPLVAICFGIVLIALLKGAFSYLEAYLMARIGTELVYTLRKELFAHLQRLSLSFHTRARSGELLTKISNDTSTVRDVYTQSALTFGFHLLTVLGMLLIMFAMDWKLGLIVVATLPILLFNLFYLYRRAKASAKRQRRKEEKIVTRISEVMSSVSLVQAFGREGYEQNRFETESSQYLEEGIRNARIEAAARRSVEIVSSCGTGAVLLVGSLQALDGHMTPGDVLIFVSYVSTLYRPMRTLARLSTQFSKAMVSAQRIRDVLEVEPEIQDSPTAIEASNLKGQLVFDNVSFNYGDGKEVLDHVSFAVSPGERLAIVGASGAGKSTLAALVLRLYDPLAGSILIDGINIKEYRRESLRGQIGIVLQDSILFGATVKENIAYGKLDATMSEIIAAARAANAHEFIADLEDGYDTIIGERGSTLSGGQRQRIAIARALIRNAPILILDEPMTGLDVESEATVREALDRLMTGRTTILITHDLQAVADANLVLVLEDGKVVESGSPKELIALGRRFRELMELGAGQKLEEQREAVWTQP